jgi:hypothetical protein
MMYSNRVTLIVLYLITQCIRAIAIFDLPGCCTLQIGAYAIRPYDLHITTACSVRAYRIRPYKVRPGGTVSGYIQYAPAILRYCLCFRLA